MAEREKRLLAGYLKVTYPDDTWMTNVELGPLPVDDVLEAGTDATRRRLRPFRRRIDAVHWTPDRFDLIECKVRDPFPGIGGLVAYESLARHTPDLMGYTGQPFHKVLLVPYSLEWVKLTAADLGIELVEHWEPWIDEYFQEIQNYFTADYRARRDEKKRIRQLMGVD